MTGYHIHRVLDIAVTDDAKTVRLDIDLDRAVIDRAWTLLAGLPAPADVVLERGFESKLVMLHAPAGGETTALSWFAEGLVSVNNMVSGDLAKIEAVEKVAQQSVSDWMDNHRECR